MRNRKNKATGQPGDLHKGQRRGACGHFMQLWDTHSRCPGCRKKSKGQDPCLEGRNCDACNMLTAAQKHILRTSRTYDSRSPRRRSSPSPVSRVGSPSRARGRVPDRRPDDRPVYTQVHRSPVHRSTGHRSPVNRSPVHRSPVRSRSDRSTDQHRSGHRSPPVRPPVSTGQPVTQPVTRVLRDQNTT